MAGVAELSVIAEPAGAESVGHSVEFEGYWRCGANDLSRGAATGGIRVDGPRS